nr:DUF2933 domain-containing protein [Marinobacter salicampi]
MLTVMLFFLWEDHSSRIMGSLPWLILLACPLMHVFMHRRHGKALDSHEESAASKDRREQRRESTRPRAGSGSQHRTRQE